VHRVFKMNSTVDIVLQNSNNLAPGMPLVHTEEYGVTVVQWYCYALCFHKEISTTSNV